MRAQSVSAMDKFFPEERQTSMAGVISRASHAIWIMGFELEDRRKRDRRNIYTANKLRLWFLVDSAIVDAVWSLGPVVWLQALHQSTRA
jgi:hypothetical protein